MRAPFAPLLLQMPKIPAPYPYRCAFKGCGPACALECAKALDETIREEGPESVAAFISEPVIGASAGACAPPPDYHRIVRETCDRYGVLMISDEVMSGMGRTGSWFAIERWGVKPDIITLGKGLTSGYVPGGGVLVKGAIVEAVKAAGGFPHGFTASHHPVVAAAALAVLRYVEKHHLIERARTAGEYLQRRLKCFLDIPSVGDVRGVGLMAAVELVADRETKAPFSAERRVAQEVQAEAFRRGVVIYPSGGQADGAGDLLMIGPPLTITEGEIDELVSILADSIAFVTRSAHD
jgi:adenosylmethionine-8-amino-7-oxononanoate aminotransferase